jgi:magnesium-transporting ATPase (P-type)
MLPLMSISQSKNEQKQAKLAKIEDDLLSFAKEGLRTLVVAQRLISKEDYTKFEQDHHKIKTSMSIDKD